VGSGSFVYRVPCSKKTVKVWYYMPKTFSTKLRVLMVMHGTKRNGKDFFKSWKAQAKQANMILIVPEFSQEHFPNRYGYNLGNMITSAGRRIPEKKWAFSSIERIFDVVKRSAKLERNTYTLYGHSAGAQFVHRFMLFNPGSRVELAIAANAGWYTMPDPMLQFPYGTKGAGKSMLPVSSVFQKKLVILLGERDTDKNCPQLNTCSDAMLQGKHRLERGKNFFAKAKMIAEERGTKFNWELHYAPGVRHDQKRMASHAVEIIMGK